MILKPDASRALDLDQVCLTAQHASLDPDVTSPVTISVGAVLMIAETNERGQPSGWGWLHMHRCNNKSSLERQGVRNGGVWESTLESAQ